MVSGCSFVSCSLPVGEAVEVEVESVITCEHDVEDSSDQMVLETLVDIELSSALNAKKGEDGVGSGEDGEATEDRDEEHGHLVLVALLGLPPLLLALGEREDAGVGLVRVLSEDLLGQRPPQLHDDHDVHEDDADLGDAVPGDVDYQDGSSEGGSVLGKY